MSDQQMLPTETNTKTSFRCRSSHQGLCTKVSPGKDADEVKCRQIHKSAVPQSELRGRKQVECHDAPASPQRAAQTTTRGASAAKRGEEEEASREANVETTARESEEDHSAAALRSSLRDCQGRLGSAIALVHQLRAESEAQKRLSDASQRMLQKRLSAVLAIRSGGGRATIQSACVSVLDALDLLEGHLPGPTGAKIKSDFRRLCLLTLHPDKTTRPDQRDIECFRALQEEWRRRDT